MSRVQNSNGFAESSFCFWEQKITPPQSHFLLAEQLPEKLSGLDYDNFAFMS
jgi:hypothetical protein